MLIQRTTMGRWLLVFRAVLALVIVLSPVFHQHPLVTDPGSLSSREPGSPSSGSSLCPICAIGDGAPALYPDPSPEPLPMTEAVISLPSGRTERGHAAPPASRGPPSA